MALVPVVPVVWLAEVVLVSVPDVIETVVPVLVSELNVAVMV